MKAFNPKAVRASTGPSTIADFVDPRTTLTVQTHGRRCERAWFCGTPRASPNFWLNRRRARRRLLDPERFGCESVTITTVCRADTKMRCMAWSTRSRGQADKKQCVVALSNAVPR